MQSHPAQGGENFRRWHFRFHRAMLNQGVWLPPSQFEAAFLGTTHGEAEVAATIAAAHEAFKAVRSK